MDVTRSHHNPSPYDKHPAVPEEFGITRGFCTKVIDGDTYECEYEQLNPHIRTSEQVRLAGLDTPEVFGSNRDPVAGPAATEFVKERILGKPITLRLHRRRLTLNRVVADVYFLEEGHWRDLATALRAAGHEKVTP